jgi:N-acetylglutamate synthase-like GNAT family acetyltransferase
MIAPAMTTSDLNVRRATVDDLPQLHALWRQATLPWQDLEKRFKDFQVVQDAHGQIIAALGLQISGTEGRLHDEAMLQPEGADELRARLWERVRTLAQNHGLVRVWTQLNAPFWQVNGFGEPAPEVGKRLPAAFAVGEGPWWTAQLRNETSAASQIDREFALLKESSREENERMKRQARRLKLIASLVVLVVFALIMLWAWSFYRVRMLGPAPGP